MLAVSVLAGMAATGHDVPTWAWVLTVPVAILEFVTSDITRAFWRGLMGQ